MARVRPKDPELITRLLGFPKPYFTVTDMEKILGLERASLYVTLTRLVDAGILVRLRRNAYKLAFVPTENEKAANELYHPSYLSFESALSKYGILSQIPYTLTFATTRPSKKLVLGDVQVEYHHLKKDLYFGYVLDKSIYVATPEKALLDELYLMSRGKGAIELEELDLGEINPEQFEQNASRFPRYMGELLARVRPLIGTTPVTLETRERMGAEENEKVAPV